MSFDDEPELLRLIEETRQKVAEINTRIRVLKWKIVLNAICLIVCVAMAIVQLVILFS